MTIKFPPPPPLANVDPLFNRWLIEIQNILNSEGAIQATAVTQPPGDNSTNIATTAFVAANTASSPSTTVPLVDSGSGAVGAATTFARGDHVHPADATLAHLASPVFTGTPQAPTATTGTNTAQLATTAFVNNQITADLALVAALHDGSGVPAGGLGNVHDWYADTTNKHIYVKTAVSTWTLIV